jgi:hypothetical protein
VGESIGASGGHRDRIEHRGNKGQGIGNREQRMENREQRTENREQRIENRERGYGIRAD